MNSFWLTMFIVGVLTLGIRLSFIVILDRWDPPMLIKRSLRFVPVAVLSAIIFPELIMCGNKPDITFENLRLIAGIVAIGVAWQTKNIIWTIIIGMGALLALQYFL